MGKYIIDIDDLPFDKKGERLWRATQFKSLVFDEYGLKKLTPAKDVYEQGLQQAWDAATELAHDMSTLYVSEIMKKYDLKSELGLGAYSISEKVFRKLTPQKTIEQQKKATYQVGDIITDGQTNYLIVSIGKDSYKVIHGTDFEPVSIGKDYITQFTNVNDRKDMEKFRDELEV